MPSLAVAFSALSGAALLHQANAHGYISQPKPEFVPGKMYTNFNAEFTAADTKIASFQGRIFHWSPEQNTQQFTEGFKASGLKSLKELMDKFVPDCGNTNPNTTPRDVTGLKTMNFQNNEYKEGFLNSHHGPCEIWFDDERVFQNDDCAGTYKSYPAELPVDYSKCKGTCRLTFYWLALHSQKWQAYKQCVPIKSGAGGGGSGGTAPTPSSSTPTVTSAPKPPAAPSPNPPAAAPAPAPTTAKPASVAPEATPPAPAPSAAPASSPAPSSKNCKRRARRTQEA